MHRADVREGDLQVGALVLDQEAVLPGIVVQSILGGLNVVVAELTARHAPAELTVDAVAREQTLGAAADAVHAVTGDRAAGPGERDEAAAGESSELRQGEGLPDGIGQPRGLDLLLLGHERWPEGHGPLGLVRQHAVGHDSRSVGFWSEFRHRSVDRLVAARTDDESEDDLYYGLVKKSMIGETKKCSYTW